MWRWCGHLSQPFVFAGAGALLVGVPARHDRRERVLPQGGAVQVDPIKTPGDSAYGVSA